MKSLKKLALVAAVAAAPFANAELKSLDDAMLGDVTGQAGITIDLDLAMTIEEIRYVDKDGVNNGQGYLTFSNVKVGAIDFTNGTLGTVSIRGVKIDVDGTDGVVINFGQIGSVTAAGLSGIDFAADFGINGGDAGSFLVTDFTNFAPASLLAKMNAVFGYNLGGGDTFINGQVEIAGRTDGTSGLTIDAEFGGLMTSAGWYDKDTGKGIGVANLAFFGEDAGNISAMKISGLTVDVVDHNGTDALKLGGVNMQGTIAMGDIFIGDMSGYDKTTGDHSQSIGSVLIKNIDMSSTDVYVYAH